MVNIRDFIIRLCNDIYKSIVHRVYNQSTSERVSMPFFFSKYYIYSFYDTDMNDKFRS